MTLTKVWSVLKYLVKNGYLEPLEAKVIFDKIIEDRLYKTLKIDKRRERNLFEDEETPF